MVIKYCETCGHLVRGRGIGLFCGGCDLGDRKVRFEPRDSGRIPLAFCQRTVLRAAPITEGQLGSAREK